MEARTLRLRILTHAREDGRYTNDFLMMHVDNSTLTSATCTAETISRTNDWAPNPGILESTQ